MSSQITNSSHSSSTTRSSSSSSNSKTESSSSKSTSETKTSSVGHSSASSFESGKSSGRAGASTSPRTQTAQSATQTQTSARAQTLANTQGTIAAHTLMNTQGAAHTLNAMALTSGRGVNAQGTTGVNGVQAAQTTGATDAAIAAQVAQEVKALSAQGGDAAQIMTLAHQRAVELVRQQYPNAPVTERMDRAMAIATYVLNGPGVVDNLGKVDSGKTQVVPYMRDIVANDPQGAGFAGMGLDSTNGGGTFYQSYNDGTNNQAYHTNFFIAAGYVAGKDVGKVALAQSGNIYHETLDPDAWGNGGGSRADYAASSTGIIAGSQLYTAREYAAESEQGLHASGANMDLLMPTFVAGYVSKDGTQPPRVAGTSDQQYQAEQQLMTSIADQRSSFFFQLATEKNPVAALLVTFFELPPWLRGTTNSPLR